MSFGKGGSRSLKRIRCIPPGSRLWIVTGCFQLRSGNRSIQAYVIETEKGKRKVVGESQISWIVSLK
jgi:hypothetical protein